MPTSIDVFAKVREFERLELLQAAREHSNADIRLAARMRSA